MKQKERLIELEKVSMELRASEAGNPIKKLTGPAGGLLLLSFFSLLTNFASKKKPLVMDRDFDEWLSKNKNDGLAKYLKGFTVAGSEPSTLSLAVAASGILWRRKQPLAACLVLISTIGAWLLSRPVKMLVKRPRPFSLNTLKNHPDANSFPSGHSVVAIAFYGILAWLGLKFFKRRLTRFGWALLMVYIILMIGFSRAYLEEHHPSDVLGGYLLGGFWLTVTVCAANLYQTQEEE